MSDKNNDLLPKMPKSINKSYDKKGMRILLRPFRAELFRAFSPELSRAFSLNYHGLSALSYYGLLAVDE